MNSEVVLPSWVVMEIGTLQCTRLALQQEVTGLRAALEHEKQQLARLTEAVHKLEAALVEAQRNGMTISASTTQTERRNPLGYCGDPECCPGAWSGYDEEEEDDKPVSTTPHPRVEPIIVTRSEMLPLLAEAHSDPLARSYTFRPQVAVDGSVTWARTGD